MTYTSLAYRLAGRANAHGLAAPARWVDAWCARRAAGHAVQLRSELAGKPVLILGSGPALNTLTPEQFRNLERRFFVIGVNRTFYRCRLDVFLSSYPSEHCLALMHADRCRHRIQMRPTSFVPVVKGSVGWKRVVLGAVPVNETLGDGAPPVVRTKLNVALGATDLAVRLGGRDIYFLGVEQNNQAHYYDRDEAVKLQIRSDVTCFIGNDAPFSADHPYGAVTRELERLDRPPEELENTPFYQVDHADTFGALFEDLRRYGASFTSLGEDTVVSRSGARVASPATVLDD